ncbi:Class E basic helix-loop-helix protein 40, partial [Tinamus guttatus]
LDFAHMFPLYKPRRGLKRGDDSKETYKLPHRLIEKKRRDRINECIAQLKDLLPEHLKLTVSTRGHGCLWAPLERCSQIAPGFLELVESKYAPRALSGGREVGDLSPRSLDSSQEMFRSGFQLCAKEMLQYLAKHESGKELKCSQLAAQLHRVAAEALPAKRSRLEVPEDDGPLGSDALGSPGAYLGPHAHQPPLCLPFYLIPPSATAYLPMLEKCWYPASVPVLYPSLPASAAALTGFMNPDKISPPLLLPQRLPSPVPARSPIDSSALLQALKQIPPLNLETKD